MSLIRYLSRLDAPRVSEHLLRLDTLSRRLRFGAAMSDRAIRAYVDRLDWACVTLVGFCEAGAIRGLAELVADRPDRPRTAEAAFSVEAGWRRVEIGHTLLHRLLRAAAASGIRTIQLSTTRGHTAMLRLAARHGTIFHRTEGETEGELLGTLTVPPITVLELLVEAAAANSAPVWALFDDLCAGPADNPDPSRRITAGWRQEPPPSRH